MTASKDRGRLEEKHSSITKEINPLDGLEENKEPPRTVDRPRHDTLNADGS